MSLEKNEFGLVYISRVIALISLIIGVLILITYYLTEFPGFVFMGLLYLSITILINCIFLFGLIVKLLTKISDKKQTLISIGVLLINIPLVIIFYNTIIHIIGTVFD